LNENKPTAKSKNTNAEELPLSSKYMYNANETIVSAVVYDAFV
jgi:hypothetical protein